MTISFRRASDDDVERLLEVHFAAFPDPRGSEERKRNFALNPWGELGDLVVAERDGAILAHAFLFSLEAWFGGNPVKIGAIASVGVAPEARGQGVFSALMAQLHRAADARHAAITLLYAFRQGIYAREGYAATTPRRTRAFAPSAIPADWVVKGRARRPLGRDRDAIIAAYERAAARESGWLVRPTRLWDRLFTRERRQLVVVDGPDRIAGYVAFVLSQPEPHARTSLVVDELVAEDDATLRTLYGFLRTMGTQVHEICQEVRIDDPLDAALVDADRFRHGTEDVEHELGVVVGGPMVRIEDPAKAVEARGYRRDADVSFDLVLTDDAPGPSAIAVDIRGGAAVVSAARGGPSVQATRRGLAALLYGGFRLGELAATGLVTASPGMIAKIEPILAIPPLWPLDPF